MSEQPDPEPYLGTCPNIHPYGASYSLQHKIANDGVAECDRVRPRPLLCSWCDFEELKQGDGHPARGLKVNLADAKALHR